MRSQVLSSANLLVMPDQAEKSDTFPKLLLGNAIQRGDQPAIREKRRGIWRTMTWRDLAEEAAALAMALQARGLRRGAHVAFLGDNRPRLYVGMAAVHMLGGVAVPLYQDATADEMANPLQRAEVTHVFAEDQEQVDKLLEILPLCPTIRHIIHDNDRGMRHYNNPQLGAYSDLLQEGRELAASNDGAIQDEAARGSGQDTAFLFFTSGTTGPAKGVVLAHAALIDRAREIAATEGLNASDTTMAYLPPGWVGQALFSYVLPMVVGYCVCCPESSDTLLANMREIGPTCFLATPRVWEALFSDISTRLDDTGGLSLRLYRRGMAEALVARPRAGNARSIGDRIASGACDFFINSPLRDVLGISRVRVAYTAGDAIAPDLLMFFRALGINLKQLYGSTETGFCVAMHSDDAVKRDSVGRAGQGVEVKISPQREILVRSAGLFKEYHRDPKATVGARDDEGWFHTGDAGYLGEDGHLRIIDRLVNVGTLNDGTLFAPKLIENRLKFLPYVKEAVAFGDGRDRVCVLVDIDVAAVGRWADKNDISYTGHADLASRGEVYGLIGECISGINADLARDPTLAKSQIHRFLILRRELHPDDGALTRTGKLRRGVIAERYRPLVAAMYEGLAEVSVVTESTDDPESMHLKIGDAKTSAPAQATGAI